MFTHTKKDLGKATFQFDVSVPKEDIKQEYDHALSHILKNFEAPGFRKGNVPREIAESKLSKESIYQEMVEHMLPGMYQEILKKENIKPIINPKIDLVNAKEGEDWQIQITVCERPVVDLGKYKEKVAEMKKDLKADEIWVPGKDIEATPVSVPPGRDSDEAKEEKKRKLLNKIFEILLENAKVEISDLLVEQEMNNKLAQLVDDVRKIGLTVEAYLKSRNETMEGLKAKYATEITEMYKMELVLDEVADKEKIIVEEKDLDALFTNIKDEKQKEEAKKNAYYYATMVKRQKTLDYLNSL